MSNIAYVLRRLNQYDKAVVWLALALSILDVAVPFVGILLPPLILRLLIDGATSTQIIVQAGGFTLLLVVLYFLRNFCNSNRGWRTNSIIFGGAIDIFNKNLECDYRYLEDPDKQAVFSRLWQNSKDPEFCYNSLLNALTGFITGVLGFALYSLILSGLNMWVVLLLTITATLNYFMLRSANKFEHKNKENWTPLERKIAYLLRVTRNYRFGKDVRMYNMQPWLVNLARSLFAERSGWDSKVQHRHFASRAVNAVIALLRDGIAYAVLIYMVAAGQVGISEFILFFGAIAGLSAFVTHIIDSISNAGRALPYVNDMREYLAGGDIEEPENPVKMPDMSSPPMIEFQNVSFSYTPEKKVIDNMTFTIGAGEKVALVGLNGAGKTTLVKLLCGFLTPDEGTIRIYGNDIQNYRKDDLFSLFSAVFQDEFIPPVTLAENIAPRDMPETDITGGNTASLVISGLERAGLWEHVSTLPNGLNSLMTKSVREDGIELSGGQKQKLYLARALYKDAPVLILDEPTAALDPIAENKIYEQYHELSGGKTSIFISHRLASTRFCDKILLLENGKITETGSHDELINLGGQYAYLYEVQSHYYKEEEVSDYGENASFA